jgi:hypothetical protein
MNEPINTNLPGEIDRLESWLSAAEEELRGLRQYHMRDASQTQRSITLATMIPQCHRALIALRVGRIGR